MGKTIEDPVHRHERSDVAARWPLIFGAGFLLMLPVVVALVALLMNTLWAVQPAADDVFTHERRVVDAPQLLVHPQARMDALRARWQQRLGSYGWVDRGQGIVHIPIEVAMQHYAAHQAVGGTKRE